MRANEQKSSKKVSGHQARHKEVNASFRMARSLSSHAFTGTFIIGSLNLGPLEKTELLKESHQNILKSKYERFQKKV